MSVCRFVMSVFCFFSANFVITTSISNQSCCNIFYACSALTTQQWNLRTVSQSLSSLHQPS